MARIAMGAMGIALGQIAGRVECKIVPIPHARLGSSGLDALKRIAG